MNIKESDYATPAYKVAYQKSPVLAEQFEALLGKRTTDKILNQFNSLSTLFQATPDALMANGFTLNEVGRIKAIQGLFQHYQAPAEYVNEISSPADAANLMMFQMQDLPQEYLYVVCTDTRNRPIGKPHEVYHGSLNSSLIRVGEIYAEAIRRNANAVIVYHNHPSGDCSPSPEDIQVTKAIQEASRILDIQLLDHIIIGKGRFISLKERGFIQ